MHKTLKIGIYIQRHRCQSTDKASLDFVDYILLGDYCTYTIDKSYQIRKIRVFWICKRDAYIHTSRDKAILMFQKYITSSKDIPWLLSQTPFALFTVFIIFFFIESPVFIIYIRSLKIRDWNSTLVNFCFKLLFRLRSRARRREERKKDNTLRAHPQSFFLGNDDFIVKSMTRRFYTGESRILISKNYCVPIDQTTPFSPVNFYLLSSDVSKLWSLGKSKD